MTEVPAFGRRELAAEMASAEQVDILVSFIKWSGLHLLIPAFAELRERRIPVREITTSSMGAFGIPCRRRCPR